MPSQAFYQSVARYYDREACHYEDRYWSNFVAQRIRQAFREEVKRHPFRTVLEIGCGTGLDVSHFGSIYPERAIYGIDIAPAMVASATEKLQGLGLENVTVRIGTPEDLEALFPDTQFDHIYVLFGALNTVPDLREVAGILRKRLKRDGTMVLTFVNKWYLAEMLINLVRFKIKRAFMRIGQFSSVFRNEKNSAWQLALQHYLAALSVHPHDVRVLDNISSLRLLQASKAAREGHTENIQKFASQARDRALEAISFNPGDQFRHYRRAQAEYLLGNLNGVHEAAQKALDQPGEVGEQKIRSLLNAQSTKDLAVVLDQNLTD